MKKTENFIQQEIVMKLTNKYCLKHHNPRCLIFSVPNGGKRDSREAKSLKNTGLLKGVSDLIFIMPNRTIFFEVKTEEGYQSQEQKEFSQRINDLGFEYYLVRSIEDCIIAINKK